VVREKNPLPSICGRVCHHPCETVCRSGEDGEAIAIRALKHFVADLELDRGIPIEKPEATYPEKVAIIGSGPSGLTCAYFLGKWGYEVTIFEKLPVPGGMLAVGIPDYRLSKRVLNLEVDALRQMGVEIRTNTTIGKDIQISDLMNEGYKAIFIGAGAHKGLKMNIPGEELDGVIDAVEFLKDINLGNEVKVGEKVAVIGGGNAAIDAARVAKRLGKDVEIFYRRTRTEMPAQKTEVDEAINEEINIHFLTAPVRVLSTNGRIEGIECIRMELGDVDESGRRRPVPIEGSEYTVSLDTLIPAIGQEPEISFLGNGSGLETTKWNTIKVDQETLYTGKEGIFAGGDVVTGPQTVSEAMAQGKIAAESIHKYLRGESLTRKYEVTRPIMEVEATELTEEEIEKLERPEMPSQPATKRIANFNEVELGFTKEMAVNEAKRCLRCDLREE